MTRAGVQLHVTYHSEVFLVEKLFLLLCPGVESTGFCIQKMVG